MIKTALKKEIFVTVALITLILVSRLSSHVWNFTAVGGAALFAGAYFQRKYLAVLVPLMGLIMSDFIIGMHTYMTSVYLSFALVVALGASLEIGGSRIRIFLTSLAGATLFFLVTNFDCWLGNSFYTQDFAGLMNSYYLGLPFFKTQLISDISVSFVLFEASRHYSKVKNQIALANQ